MNVWQAASEAWRLGRPSAMATVIDVGGSTPRSAGARMWVSADGDIVGTVGGGALEHEVIRRAREVIRTGRPERTVVHLVQDLGMCCGGRVEVYVEPIEVRVPLVIFGAGHVASALAPVARSLDFDVTVIDDRPDLNTAERFPGCTLRVEDPRRAVRGLAGDPRAFHLVLTHDHALDQDLVEALLPLPCAWLGMIGSRRKVARFLVRYRAAGVDPALFSRLSAPVGLDIGAETPAEIAVAIAAELVRVRRAADRDPVPLSSHSLEARGGPARPPGWSEG